MARINLVSFIEVEDEHHGHLFTLTFAEAVAISRTPPSPPAG
jgi:hypothetical protein